MLILTRFRPLLCVNSPYLMYPTALRLPGAGGIVRPAYSLDTRNIALGAWFSASLRTFQHGFSLHGSTPARTLYPHCRS